MERKLIAGLGALAALLMGGGSAVAHQGADDEARVARGGWSYVARDGAGQAGKKLDGKAVEAPIVVATNRSSNTSSDGSSNRSR